MIEDKKRWNKRYIDSPMPDKVSNIIQKYINNAYVGQALDLACGTGRNTHFLSDKGFIIDAVDISDYALSQIKKSAVVNTIDTDLDNYNITPNKYDLIVNINYLNRRLVSQMKDGLKGGGVVIFETFIVANEDYKLEKMNPNYLLRKNELLDSFIGLNIIYYEEREDINFRGEKVNIASLVAKK
jgi:SAM-dependent methyltransferase